MSSNSGRLSGLRRTVMRAAFIVVLSAAAGLISNVVSPKGIPFITPPKPALKSEELITLDQAQEWWSGGLAFFLDARAPADFQAGHIASARSLPAESFDEHFSDVAPMLTEDSQIVVYCDGEECDLSHRVATRLREGGYSKVHILVNGWTVWRKAGLPTENQGTPP